MKKLMTALAAAATALITFSAAHAGQISGTSFNNREGLTVGTTYTVDALRKADTEDDKYYWFATNVSTEVGFVTNDAYTVSSKPDAYSDTVSGKYLSLDTSTPIYRTICDSSGAGGSLSGLVQTNISENGLYLDTLVKFTAADDVFGADALEDGDKIAISYVEQQKGNITNKNFVIRAGYIGSSVTYATNYYATVPEGFSVTNWYRLTVRTINGIDAAGNVGFVVYLNETPLSYGTDVACGYEFSATGTAASFYTSTLHALFPSVVQSGAYKTSLSAVAFKGNGCVDDISFTADTPEFISSTETIPLTVTLGTGIASVTVTVGESVIEAVEGVYPLPAGTTSFTLGYTLQTGYTFAGIEGGTYNEGTVTWETTTPNITVKATRNNFTYTDGDGVEQTATTLTAALAGAGNGTTITLAYDYTLADWSDSGYYVIDGKSVTLDLNGKTINAGTDTEEDALFTVNTGAGLTVITSVAGGKIIYDTPYAIFYCEGDVYIGAASGDEGVAFDGILTDAEVPPIIVRGKFDTASNGTEAFTFAGELAEGSTCASEAVEGYWVVTPAAAATYALTIPEVTGASAVVTDAESQTISDLTAIAEGTVVTVTWTADSGYAITAGATEEITMNANKTATEPTVVAVCAIPTAVTDLTYDGTLKTGVATGTGYTITDNTATNAGNYTATATLESGYVWSDNTTADKEIAWSIDQKEVTATLTLSVTKATYDSSKTTPGAYTEPTISFGDDTLTATTDYTAAWSSEEVTSEGGTFTYTVAPVDGSNYTFTQVSATLTVTKASSYPSYINTSDATIKGKYETWAATYSVTDGSSYEAAFLLNVDPTSGDTQLDSTAITISGTTITITTDHTNVNGYPYVKSAATLEALDAATPVAVEIGSTGAVTLTGESGASKFYRVGVSATQIDAE